MAGIGEGDRNCARDCEEAEELGNCMLECEVTGRVQYI